MARKIVAGNWKMNLLAEEANQLFESLCEENEGLSCELVICPPALYLQGFAAKSNRVSLGGQNVAKYEKGAFTGEWSSEMLRSLNLEYCIVGHSERRNVFQESDEDVNDKVKLLLKNGIMPIVCCGETLDQREIGIEQEVVKDQLLKALEGVSNEEIDKVVIAYEPVWAIGTGVTASADQAQIMHKFIRMVLQERYGDIAKEIPLLYGGSCKPNNAQELFACEDIDGGLIGGASLKAESFIQIAKSFS